MATFPRIVSVRHIADYVLELTFSDDVKAPVDFKDKVVGRGRAFAALEDVKFFAQACVDADAGTVAWPNGVDFCPDVLYSEATGKPIPAF